MCESETPRMDDTAPEPKPEEGKVQTEIRIQGRWFYRGTTTDVPTLQRLLKDAVLASDKLIKRVVKARRQRDTARQEAKENCQAIVLSLTNALRNCERVGASYARSSIETDRALVEAEKVLRVKDADGSYEERITRIASIALQAMHTALIAQSHERIHPTSDKQHYLEYAVTPHMVDAAQGHQGYLLENIKDRLMAHFNRDAHVCRTIVMRVQDW